MSPDCNKLAFETALLAVATDDGCFGVSDFDPTHFLNKAFPHENAEEVDAIMETLQKEELKLEDELTESLREASICSAAFVTRLNIQADLDKLTTQLRHIETRATEAYATVSNLSSDIKSLDTAKAHLTMTVTRLKRFIMLIQALEELRKHAHKRQYKQAANLLLACNNLAVDFLDLTGNKITELFDSKKQLALSLRQQIIEDYDTLMNEEEVPMELFSALTAVDALEIRDEILTRFCLRLLDPYQRLFSPPAKLCGLDSVEKRFTWLSHTLTEFSSKYGKYFAPHWNCERVLCEHFCHMTKQHFVEVCSDSKNPQDRELLVRVIRKSISFENDLTKRFNTSFRGLVDCFDVFLPEEVADLSEEVSEES